MQLQKTLTAFATLTFVTFSISCAKTNIGNIKETDSVHITRPSRILIQDFTVDSQSIQTSSSPFAKLKSAITDDSADDIKNKLGNEVIDALSKELEEKVKALGINTVRVNKAQLPSQNEIVISGQFVKIDEGNAIRRNLIGLGAGQSSIDTKVQVSTQTAEGNQVLLNFNAHADSGNMPGAVVLGPAGAAAGAGTAAVAATNVAKGAASAYKSDSANQASALADKITETLSSYFKEQGWINSDNAK